MWWSNGQKIEDKLNGLNEKVKEETTGDMA